MENTYKNIKKLFKKNLPAIMDGAYIELGDREGWTNGYIADFGAEAGIPAAITALKTAQAQAMMLDVKGKLSRFSPKGTNNPDLARVLPEVEGTAVTKITADLSTIDFVELSGTGSDGETVTSHANPAYIAYFIDIYGDAITLRMTEKHKAIKVVSSENIVGLIMPIRQPE